MSFRNLVGMRFGRLKVISFSHKKKSGGYRERKSIIYWKCKCDCGKVKVLAAYALGPNRTKSCGCLLSDTMKKRMTTHGLSKTRLHTIWSGMRKRCYLPTTTRYECYGGRGIKVCEEWRNSFMAFHNWAIFNGYEKHLTIDRIDNDGDYTPDNCRWATRKEQMNNTSDNVRIEIDGEIYDAEGAANVVGLPPQILEGRWARGQRGADLFRPYKQRRDLKGRRKEAIRDKQ